jgi:hypothetical protein
VAAPAAGWVVSPPAAELPAAATTAGPEPLLACSWTKTNHPYCLPQRLGHYGGFAGLPALPTALRELSLRGVVAVIQGGHFWAAFNDAGKFAFSMAG